MSSKVLPPETEVDRIVWRPAAAAAGPHEAFLAAPLFDERETEPERDPPVPEPPPAPPEPPVVIIQGVPAEEVDRLVEAEGVRRAAEGYQQGLREGKAKGEAEALQHFDPLFSRLARTIEDLAAAGRQLRKDAEEDVVRLAITIARRILHRELHVDPDALLGIVRAALDRLDARELHRIRVHPDDAPRLTEELARLSLPKRIEISPDRSLERGALLFETARGTLDASFETQLDEIDRGLTDALRRRP